MEFSPSSRGGDGHSSGPYVQSQGCPTEFERFQECPIFDSEGWKVPRSPLIVRRFIDEDVLF